jgi:kynurenine 3-monooxygenase
MTAAFEDCLALDLCLAQEQPDGRERAFRSFEASRKPDADVLAQLSKDNFIELHMKVRSAQFVARKRIDLLMQRLLPGLRVPLYSLIAHSTIPCAEALRRFRRRDRLLRLCGVSLICEAAAMVLAGVTALRARLWSVSRERAPLAPPAAYYRGRRRSAP